MFTSLGRRGHLRSVGLGLVGAAAVAVLAISTGSTASAVGDSGPDTCLEGYVWRETVPADHVCVTPAVRAQVQADNAAAGQRRMGDGACLPGYVWRGAAATGEADYEAAVSSAYAAGQDLTTYVQAHMDALAANDHVCVTSEVRSQTASDNLAWDRRVLTMRLNLSPYNATVLHGAGFNAGTAYVEVVRRSDNAVLWQTWISTNEWQSFRVDTPFNTCTENDTPTRVYLRAYDYTAGVWRTEPMTSDVC